MAVANTISAHSISDCFSRCTLRSTRRFSHDGGNNADTVNRPSGGNAQRLPSKGSAWRKLQYVSGNSGLTNKTFTTLSSSKTCTSRGLQKTLTTSSTLGTLLPAKFNDVT